MKSAVLHILGSNALSQLLIIASTPLLTRQYDQEIFGWFGVTTTISLLLSTLASLKFEQSIHVTVHAPAQLFSACLQLIVLVLLCVFIPAGAILIWFDVLDMADAVFIVLFAISHAATTSALLHLNYWQRFRAIGALNLLIPVIFVAGALLVPQAPFGANALLLWQAIAYTGGAMIGVWLQRQHVRILSVTNLIELLRIERHNWQFLVPSSLLTILSLNMSVIGVTALFDAHMAGLVVIAQRVARAPVSVIGNSLNEVLRASIPGRSRMRQTFNSVAWICTITSVCMLIGVVLVPDTAYERVLGQGWTGLRTVLLITVAGACFQLVGTSVASMLTSFQKRSDLMVNAGLFSMSVLAIAVTWLASLEVLAYLWIQAGLSAVVYTVAFVIAYRLAREHGADAVPPSPD